MKTTKLYFKKLVCAAAILAVMTSVSCGSVDDGSSDQNPTSAAAEISDSSQAEQTESSSTDTSSEDDKKPDQPSEEIPLSDEFINGYNNFSIELFKKAAGDDLADNRNVLLSPESAIMALGMTANGANGDTLDSMLDVLCGGLPIDDFNSNMLNMKNMSENSEGLTFNIANSIWVRDEADRIKLNGEFADKASEYFGADVFLKQFDSATLDEINSWVDENTNHMIPSILNRINDTAVTYLINAIAFESEWDEQYEEKQILEERDFKTADGEVQKVTMLASAEREYISGDGVTGFIKPYKGGDYAFMALLPDENTSISDYAESMTGENFKSLFDSRKYCDVAVQMPEFTYDYDRSLSNPLIDMGMGTAFETSADFSGMAETDTDMLYIQEVLQKTYIKLDRNGTKAAAATAVIMTDAAEAETPEPEVVILDRPFIYAIVDTENGLPVFLGAVNSVK